MIRVIMKMNIMDMMLMINLALSLHVDGVD